MPAQTMKLYLAQHGPAVDKSINRDRPLSDIGQEEVNGVAKYLKQSNAKIAGIYHSGKTRAEQTAEIFASQLGIGNVEQLDGLNPNDDVEAVVEKINSLTDDTMIVTHIPFLPRMVSRLLTGDPASEASALPGNIVCLDRDAEGFWSLAGCCAYDSFDQHHHNDAH
jgi:phosphohistidine phosphatase